MPLTTTKGKQSKPRRIMLYGVHGIGKSTFAAGAPNAVFLPTEDGIADIDCESFPLAESYDDVIGYLTQLATEDHDRETLVVDSVDWLERLIWQKVIEEFPTTEKGKAVENIEDYGYAKGYKFAMKWWREILRYLEGLRTHKGLTLVLLAHSRAERHTPPDNDAYDRYSPKLHKEASEVLQEWCDEVFFANYQVFTKKEGSGFNERNIAVGTGNRVMHTAEMPAYKAKNRIDNLPLTLPLSWQEYADAISF